MRRAAALLLLLPACGGCPEARPAMAVEACAATPQAFVFGALGDLPYDAPDREWRALISDVGQRRPAFAVHVGDIKTGSARCTDEHLKGVLADFTAWPVPLVYTPGDNEWTDCWRTGFDPRERLAKIRELFFAGEASLGAAPMPVLRQAAPFRENVRWERGGVVFATLHEVGSDNGTERGEAGDREAAARTEANLHWLREAFAAAKDRAGLALFLQADMHLENPRGAHGAYEPLVAALESEAAANGKPVLLVNGDTHVFRVDRPFERAPHLLRVIVFGDDAVHWVEVVADPGQPRVFGVRPRFVPANPRRQDPPPSSVAQACFP